MADYLDSTGLHIDSLEERNEAVKALARALIAANLDCSPDQPTGQLIEIINERTQSALELIREVYSAWDPDNATGQALTALALITGTQRRAATYGSVTLTVNLDGGTNLPAGSIAAVSGDPDNRWVTDVAVVAPAGPAADYPVAATCEDSGPVQAVAGTITVIATPVAGWNSVNNAAAATEGLAEETDTALRLRRELELALGGSTTVDAIRADLINLEDTVEAHVYENPFDVASGGRPPHSVEAVVHGTGASAPSDAEIAEAIFEAKAAGIRTWGTTTQAHTDGQGNSHQVSFTRAAELRILVEVTLTTDSDYPGDSTLQAYIESASAAALGVGDDVYRSAITGWCMDVAGVVDVSLVRLSIHPAAVAAADVSVAYSEIATIAAADVTVL